MVAAILQESCIPDPPVYRISVRYHAIITDTYDVRAPSYEQALKKVF